MISVDHHVESLQPDCEVVNRRKQNPNMATTHVIGSSTPGQHLSSSGSHSSNSSNIVGVHYKVGKKIGEGSFGVIFEGMSCRKGSNTHLVLPIYPDQPIQSYSIPSSCRCLVSRQSIDSLFGSRYQSPQLSNCCYQICEHILACYRRSTH